MSQSRETQKRTFEAGIDDVRLDRFLAEALPDLTRSHIQKLIKSGHVTVNGCQANPARRLKFSDLVDISIPPPPISKLEPEDIDLDVIYEDPEIAVINKPAGLTVYPAPGHASHTLVNALLKRFPDLACFGDTARPGIVHRLDKDTSGLIVIARNEKTRLDLVDQFRSRSVKKDYLVLVQGKLEPERGAIDAPIGRDPANRKRMAVVTSGRAARTDYRVLRYLKSCTLAEVRIRTGRTHQIRVHMSAIGHPVVGDKKYGRSSIPATRQFLHACCLEIRLPGSGQIRSFTCPLPADLEQVLKSLDKGKV
ncbi:MAG: RluA family pseudouridine synthase [Dehalococcoidia bacterium]|nr:RluA family pseudouridine synthase [Dehalococcoidia bacterium]